MQVTERVYLAHGYSLSNIIFVATQESVVLIDTGESMAAAQAALNAFRQVCQLPVSYIIYTHHHGDHIRGASVFHTPATRVIAQRRLPLERDKVARLLQYRTRVDRLQFGLALAADQRGVSHARRGRSGYVPPDITFDKEYCFTEGGVRFELYHAPGESFDHIMVWLPEERTLCPGDLIYGSFPMLGNPMKPDRPVLGWAESLERMRALRPAQLVPSHGLPLTGADEIATTLANYAGAIRYVLHQTINLINRGFTLPEIKRHVRLPHYWRQLSYLQPRYGSVEWAVHGIFQQYAGWYDLNPTHLAPVPRARLSQVLLEVSGGVRPLLERTRAALDSGQDRLVLELTDVILGARPRHRAALRLRSSALERLGRGATNRVAQNLYRSAAKLAASQRVRRAPTRSPTLPTPRLKPQERVQPPLFILAAPRSYTSVVCAMLGQHPQMYGLPELHLFRSETMAEWFELCRNESFPRAHGMLRAVAQLFFGAQTEETVHHARSWLKARTHFTTGQLLRALAVKVYPAIVVEKSPSINLDRDALARAFRMFPRARFLHLVRHPKGHSESVLKFMRERAKYGPIPPSHWLLHLAWYGRTAADGTEPDPQHGWYALNKCITQFLEAVPARQQLTVRGEELVANPDEALVPILEWLGVRADTAAIEQMKHPEQSPYARLGPEGAVFGNDRLFLQDPALRQERAAMHSLEGPVSWRTDVTWLAPEVVELARQFGYR